MVVIEKRHETLEICSQCFQLGGLPLFLQWVHPLIDKNVPLTSNRERTKELRDDNG
ncbi:uncharacterized protein J3R85_011676 [Psidium guajava]|nr:uncharacterized protein J3R85_011676 [Psidium guajava]